MLAVSRAEPDSETILTLKRVCKNKKKSWQVNVQCTSRFTRTNQSAM